MRIDTYNVVMEKRHKGTRYEDDVVAWANEQAELLRAGKLQELDRAHIAEEIEDVGKAEQRELASRMAVLLAHLLKWQYQPDRRSNSWRATIREQRRAIAAQIAETPSLKASLTHPNWITRAWADAVAHAVKESGLDVFPESAPWPMERALTADFFPE